MGYAYRVDRIAIRETADASGCTPEELYSETYPDYKDAQYYTLNRKNAYPPVSDYLDAIVKGDTMAQKTYIDACKAIKIKYPKPI